MTTGAERQALADQVARNLKREREAVPLTRYELSERSEVKTRAITAIERGVHLPRLGTAQRLAEGIGVEVDDLIAGIAWRPPPEGTFFVEGNRAGG